MHRVEGKTAIVTGAANGIGKAIAELLAEEGAWVLLTDIEDQAGSAACGELRKRGLLAEYCHADVSVPQNAVAAVNLAAAHNGRIDILVNNAAYLGKANAILESTAEEWDRCIGVALMGTHYFTREAL